MANNIFQKKEKQELMVSLFVFLIIFIFLMSIMPPSFDFSFPEKTIKEKENYLSIINFLNDFKFNQFKEFSLIPKLDGNPGRSNPFLSEFQEKTTDIDSSLVMDSNHENVDEIVPDDINDEDF